MSEKIDNFEEAFSERMSTCRMTCNCGKIYWDGYNSGISWEEGELDELRTRPEAVRVEHSIGIIECEGRHYANVCDCWLDRAERITNFIDKHAYKIAAYLALEKKRKQLEADISPTVTP